MPVSHRPATGPAIDILTAGDRWRHLEVFDQMHRLRHRVFKERLQWEVPSVDGRERDAYDDLDAVYLLARDTGLRDAGGRDTGGRVVGTWRMLPTTGPYMLADEPAFRPLLEDRPAPRDPLIWEASRFAVDGEFFADASLATVSRVTGRIFAGVVEFCIAQGVAQVITVYDLRIARLLPRINCHARWRSAPLRIGSTTAFAGLFDATPQVLDDIRDACALPPVSVIRDAPWLETRHVA